MAGEPHNLYNGIFPEGVFTGARALTVQTYTEGNVKLGKQFESSTYAAAIAPAANLDAIFITGNVPVLITERRIQFDGTLVTMRFYKDPVYSGGSPLATYNLSLISQSPSTAQILYGAIVSSTGIESSAPQYNIGSEQSGKATSSSALSIGNERSLPANSKFLIRLTNAGTIATSASYYMSWFEGEPDLPRAGDF